MRYRQGLVVGAAALVLLAGCSSGEDADGQDTSTDAAAGAEGAAAEDATVEDAAVDDTAAEGSAVDDGGAASGEVTLVIDGTSHDLTEFETCEPGPPEVLDVIAQTADGSVVLRGTLTPGQLAAVVIETGGQQYLARTDDIEADVSGTQATVTGTASSTGSEAGEVTFDLTASCD